MSTAVVEVSRRPAGRVSSLVAEVRRRAPLLFGAAAAHLLIIPPMLLAAALDERLVTGVNPWVKPLKFAVAGAVYLVTLAWLFRDLPAGERAKGWVARIVALSMLTEITLIVMQAARGTSSHFNNGTPLDSAVFGVMGVMIVVNTVAVAYVAWRYWRAGAGLPAAYLWGVRLGLVLFILAGLEGFVMARQLAHSVGVADGGPGLPLVNWSTRGGDLRVAHFVGMHSLQVLPLVGHLLSQGADAGRVRRPALWVWAVAALYGALALFVFAQALAGRPLLAW